MPKSKKILEGHKRIGNKFIPPAKHLINLSETNWIEDVLPELIWLGVIIDKMGLRKGLEYCSYLISTVMEMSKSDKPLDFSFISSFNFLSKAEIEKLINNLKEKGYYNDISNSLQDFIQLYSQDNPLSFLKDPNYKFDQRNAIFEFKEILSKYFNRRTISATIIQTILPYSRMRAGKLHYSSHIEPLDFNAIVDDFESDKAKKSASSTRAFVNMSYGLIEQTITKKWAKYFWNNGLKLEKLEINKLTDNEFEYEGKDDFYNQIVKYEKYVDQAVIERWNKLPKDLYEHQIIEVLGAILARQATLAKRIARNPENWDFHIGPILLRAMIDVHITLSWVLTDPLQISKKFIEYGLGQEKLQIEHLEDENDNEDDKPLLDIMIEAKKSWLNDQHYSFLTTVDVGNWSGHSTRDIAEEAGCRNLYRFAYSPFSSCAHSMWNHIGKFNVRFSENSLHKYIRIPFDPDIPPQPETLFNSAKYLLKSLMVLDKHFKLEIDDFDPIDFWYKYFDSKKDEEGVKIKANSQ